jgi:hypothetical protein
MVKKRQDDATSKETLEDLEDAEDSVETNETEGPSPDGAFDDAHELKDADPF